MTKIKDRQSIKSPAQEIAFLKKYYPELEKHDEGLETLLSNLAEIVTKYEMRLEQRGKEHIAKRKAALSQQKNLKEIEKMTRKTGDPEWDSFLKKKKSDLQIPASRQGNQAKLQFKYFANEVKDFWINELGHKKFIYDGGNRHPDQAKDFANDLTWLFYKRMPLGGQQAFRKVADSRKVNKK